MVPALFQAFRALGLRFRLWGLRFRVEGLGWDLGFRVKATISPWEPLSIKVRADRAVSMPPVSCNAAQAIPAVTLPIRLYFYQDDDDDYCCCCCCCYYYYYYYYYYHYYYYCYYPDSSSPPATASTPATPPPPPAANAETCTAMPVRSTDFGSENHTTTGKQGLCLSKKT